MSNDDYDTNELLERIDLKSGRAIELRHTRFRDTHTFVFVAIAPDGRQFWNRIPAVHVEAFIRGATKFLELTAATKPRPSTQTPTPEPAAEGSPRFFHSPSGNKRAAP